MNEESERVLMKVGSGKVSEGESGVVIEGAQFNCLSNICCIFMHRTGAEHPSPSPGRPVPAVCLACFLGYFCETGLTTHVLNTSLTDSQNRDTCLTNEIAEVLVTFISIHEKF